MISISITHPYNVESDSYANVQTQTKKKKTFERTVYKNLYCKFKDQANRDIARSAYFFFYTDSAYLYFLGRAMVYSLLYCLFCNKSCSVQKRAPFANINFKRVYRFNTPTNIYFRQKKLFRTSLSRKTQ